MDIYTRPKVFDLIDENKIDEVLEHFEEDYQIAYRYCLSKSKLDFAETIYNTGKLRLDYIYDYAFHSASSSNSIEVMDYLYENCIKVGVDVNMISDEFISLINLIGHALSPHMADWLCDKIVMNIDNKHKLTNCISQIRSLEAFLLIVNNYLGFDFVIENIDNRFVSNAIMRNSVPDVFTWIMENKPMPFSREFFMIWDGGETPSVVVWNRLLDTFIIPDVDVNFVAEYLFYSDNYELINSFIDRYDVDFEHFNTSRYIKSFITRMNVLRIFYEKGFKFNNAHYRFACKHSTMEIIVWLEDKIDGFDISEADYAAFKNAILHNFDKAKYVYNKFMADRHVPNIISKRVYDKCIENGYNDRAQFLLDHDLVVLK